MEGTMKITIESEDAYEIEGLMNAENLRCALCDMGNYLRSASDKGDSEDVVLISDVYEKYFELINENKLDRNIIGF